MFNKLASLIVIFSCFSLSGCANHRTLSATKFTAYEDFRPGPENGVELVWARLGLRDPQRLQNKLQQYDSVIIDRIYIVVDNDELSNEQINTLSGYLQDKLKSAISPYKKIVTAAGEKTLRVSIALSNIETANPLLVMTSSLLPVGIGISVISKITTGEHTNVGRSTIELMVRDSSNDDALFAAIDRRTGNKDFGSVIDSLDDAKDAIDWWVDRLAVTLSKWKKI